MTDSIIVSEPIRLVKPPRFSFVLHLEESSAKLDRQARAARLMREFARALVGNSRP